MTVRLLTPLIYQPSSDALRYRLNNSLLCRSGRSIDSEDVLLRFEGFVLGGLASGGLNHASNESGKVDDVDRRDQIISFTRVAKGTGVLEPGCFEELIETTLSKTISDT